MNKLKNIVKINFTDFLLILLFGIFFIRFWLKIHTGLLEELSFFTAILSLVSVLSLKNIVSIPLSRFPYVKLFTETIFILSYAILTLYHFRMGVGIDFSIMMDNSDIALNKDSILFVLKIFKRQDYITLLIILFTIAFFELRHKAVTRASKQNQVIKLLISLSIFSMCSVLPVATFDCYSLFSKSVYRYYFNNPENLIKERPATQYPLIHKHIAPKVSEPPHVIILMLESFNPNFIDKLAPNGLEYMPFFNQLKKRGWFYNHFWAHSIQTAKAQFGILCSLTPVTRGKVFTDYTKTTFNCLPNILKENGYYTFFFKGYDQINFDNTYQFTTKNGFIYSRGQDRDLVSNEERKKVAFNWGVRDDVTYKNFFKEIDKIHQKQSGKIFATVTSLSTHSPFDVPKDEEIVFKNPKNRFESYNNAIILADNALKVFFEEYTKRDYLKNSILFIMGDHGYPLGEHGNYYQSSNAYEENFRTPLLIFSQADKRFAPKIVKEARSQQDIAPTILDLTGISTETHFQGTSLLGPAPQYIPLIQPYAGRYIGVISYPIKYVFHLATLKEYVFDLAKDPLEKNNLIGQYRNLPIYQEFKNQIGNIFLSEELIKTDRIWPKQQ